jgi:copper chaperone NosL
MSMRAGEEAKNVTVASYLHPETMIPSSDAAYVVGSTAAGTMTMVSKVAFASADEAKRFAAVNGGEVLDYQATLARASAEVEKSRASIDAKRKKTGKVKEPAATDSCVVCSMPPEKFPMHRAQILTADDSSIHFCSNQCLVNYLADSGKYLADPPKNKWIWGTVYPDGDIDNADGLYYVVGSKMHGPMGPEALPFRKKADADAFADKEGGSVLHFNELTPEKVGGGHGMGGMQHGHM